MDQCSQWLKACSWGTRWTGKLRGKGSNTGMGENENVDGVVIVHHQTWLDYTFLFLFRVNMASDWLWKMKCEWKGSLFLGLTHKKLSSAILYPPSFLSTSCLQRIQQKNVRPGKGLHLKSKGPWITTWKALHPTSICDMPWVRNKLRPCLFC